MAGMTDPDISISLLRESDWELWRDLRFEALRDSPAAFGETLAEARERDEDSWRSAWRTDPPLPRFIAAIDAAPRGMCSIALAENLDFQPLLIAMWISPAARGRGLGRMLLDASVDWCASNGYRQLRLGVAEDNEPAERLYQRYGFRFDGTGDPLRSDPTKLVRWMNLPIPTQRPTSRTEAPLIAAEP